MGQQSRKMFMIVYQHTSRFKNEDQKQLRMQK